MSRRRWLAWHNDPTPDAPRWRAEQSDIRRIVGYAVKTGTHLDDYPWDWYLVEGVEPWPGRKSSGVSDTLRDAKDKVASALGLPS